MTVNHPERCFDDGGKCLFCGRTPMTETEHKDDCMSWSSTTECGTNIRVSGGSGKGGDFRCTRPLGHDGRHAACGCEFIHHPLVTWISNDEITAGTQKIVETS